MPKLQQSEFAEAFMQLHAKLHGIEKQVATGVQLMRKQDILAAKILEQLRSNDTATGNHREWINALLNNYRRNSETQQKAQADQISVLFEGFKDMLRLSDDRFEANRVKLTDAIEELSIEQETQSSQLSALQNLLKQIAFLGILCMMFFMGGEVIQDRCSEIYAGISTFLWTLRSMIGNGTEYARENFDGNAVRGAMRVIFDISQAISQAVLVVLAIVGVCSFFGMEANATNNKRLLIFTGIFAIALFFSTRL